MATNGWIGEQTVHSWGSYNSRLTTNVYINGIRRYSDHIDVSGVIYLFCKSSGAKTVWYDWAITAWCGGGSLGQIKPRTYNNNILGKSWSKNFSIRINCSNSATSATFQVGFSDSNMGGKDKYWTLYFDRYATSPSGISSTATYTQYSTISTSCSGINWGQGYSNRSLTCTASYTYNGKTENFTLGTWTDGATSKSVTKSDFNFPADLNVTIKWTASTNIGSTSSTSQVRAKQTFPAPNLNNTTFTAESTAPYCIRVNVNGVDFGDNYSARKLELYGTYELDGIIYDNKLGEISNQTSWTLEYDASQEAEPWTKIPDDSSILLRLVADNGNRTSDKTIIINCQSSYEAYVIENIPEEEKEKSEVYTGKNIQIQNAPKNAPLADFKLKGNTSQQTYSGKNLLNYTTVEQKTAFGVTSSFDPLTGIITLNGTGEGNNRTITFTGTNIVVNGTYTLSVEVISGSISNATNDTAVRLFNDKWGNNFSVKFGSSSAQTTKTISDTYTRNNIRFDDGVVFNNYKIRIQLEKSSSATAFEPYVGGTPAPNPDYPQAVQTVTGENTVKVCGKNILNPSDNLHASRNGLTNVVNDDGSITTSGKPTTNWNAIIRPSVDITDRLEDGATYTFSQQVQTDKLYLQVNVYNKTTGTTQYLALNNTTSQSFTVNKSLCTYTYVIQSPLMTTWGDESLSITNYYQIEKSSIATSYEPYQEQSYEVNLGKNLFDKDNANDINGTIGSTNLSFGGANYFIYIPCQPNTTYTVQKRNDGNTNRFAVATTTAVPTAPTTTYDFVQNNDASSITITTSSTARYILVMYYRTAEATLTKQQLLDSIQIEKGSQATSYAAYFEPIELCKIGTYQDYIYKSDDKWYVRKECGKADLSEQTWTETVATIRGTTTIPNIKYASSNQQIGFALAEKYIIRQGSGLSNYLNYFAVDVSKLNVNTGSSTTNPTGLLYYALATPTDTEITNETLIAQLEAVLGGHTYAGTNNITTITPNEQGTLEIQYYTKWQNTSPAILSANGRNGTGNFKQVRRIGTK